MIMMSMFLYFSQHWNTIHIPLFMLSKHCDCLIRIICLNCHKYQISPFSYCSGFSQPKIWQLLYSVSQINWSFIPNLMEIIIWSEVSTTKLKMLKTFNSVKSSPIPQQQVGEDGSYSISLATVRDLTELIKCQHSNYLIFITKAI